MVPQVQLLLLVDETLLLLSALVLLNDTEERVTLEFCLLSEHFFAFHELLLACNVESLGLAAFLFGFCNLFGTFAALILLKGTLLTKSINLSLTVSSTFLKITEAFYF